MYFESLLNKAQGSVVRVLLIGAGQFGNSFIFQSTRSPGLEVVAVCDRDVSKGVQTFIHAGRDSEEIVICDSTVAAEKARQKGKVVVTADAHLLMDLPIDAIVEATGSPEAGVAHAVAALRNGKHVAMASKEADSIVGPLLSAQAREAGLVYSPVDGDQPSLLMQLVMWARVIGLNVLCAGKSSEYDFIYHRREMKVVCNEHTANVPTMNELWDLGNKAAGRICADRAEALKAIPQYTVPDLIEMALVANSIGFSPDIPELHAPVSRLGEIADFLVPRERGGILSRPGVVDVVNLLREPQEVSMAGGVFIVVACEDKVSWEVLRAKGHVVNRQGTAAMIYRPSHLLGVESATTVLMAVLEGRSSGLSVIEPRLDVAGRTIKSLPAGTQLDVVGHHHEIGGVEGVMLPSRAATGSNPVPYYLMAGRRLIQDVSPGTVITVDMIERSSESLLWDLRRQMDARFSLK